MPVLADQTDVEIEVGAMADLERTLTGVIQIATGYRLIFRLPTMTEVATQTMAVMPHTEAMLRMQANKSRNGRTGANGKASKIVNTRQAQMYSGRRCHTMEAAVAQCGMLERDSK